MKKLYIFFLLFLSINVIFSNTINEYDLEIAAKIDVGEDEGELKWNAELAQHFSIGKQYFIINKDNKIYISDEFRAIINVYDINFNFIEEIKVGYGISSSQRLYIDDNKNIVAISSPSGLVKVNKTGDLIFQVKYKDLPSKMKDKKEFFVFADDVLYFDNNENLIVIDSKGRIKNDFNFQNALEKYNKNTRGSNEEDLLLKEGSIKELNEFVKDKKLLKIDGVIYTGHFEKIKEHRDKIKELKKNSEDANYSEIFTKVKEHTLSLIGYDNEGNSYWEGSTEKKYIKIGPVQKIILICTKSGEIIDCFYNMVKESTVAVAPNGDVYIRENSPKDGKFHFYKITRQW